MLSPWARIFGFGSGVPVWAGLGPAGRGGYLLLGPVGFGRFGFPGPSLGVAWLLAAPRVALLGWGF